MENVVTRFISGKLEVVMTEDGELWIDALYPGESIDRQPLMRIDVEGVSGIEAFEILSQLVKDHQMLNWADEHWREKPIVPRCNTARDAIEAAMRMGQRTGPEMTKE